MRILVADDHPLFRDALELYLRRQWPDADLVFVGSLDDDEAADCDLAGETFDLVVLDWHMPGCPDSDPVSRIRVMGVKGPVAVVTGDAQPLVALEVLRSGASAFLPKTTPPKVMAQALRLVAEGGTFVPADIALGMAAAELRGVSEEDDHAEGEPDASATAPLTEREREVLDMLSTGNTNKEIARRLDLAEVTVKLHTRRILRKLGARNRADAVRRAQEVGLLHFDIAS